MGIKPSDGGRNICMLGGPALGVCRSGGPIPGRITLPGMGPCIGGFIGCIPGLTMGGFGRALMLIFMPSPTGGGLRGGACCWGALAVLYLGMWLLSSSCTRKHKTEQIVVLWLDICFKYRLDAESNGSTQCRNPRGPRLSASRAKRGRY